jgi:ESCRT-II complex subunit VPS25
MEFNFPWQYSFPPFFTLQPNEDTRKKQLDAWCDLVLSYCKQKRLFQLDVSENQSSELFNNRKLDRKCSVEFIHVIIDELVRLGRAEWIGAASDVRDGGRASKQHSSPKQVSPRKCFIYWHTLEEWSKLIYDYVARNAMQNSVCTFFELTESSECEREAFYKLDSHILRKALEILQTKRKAEIIHLDVNSQQGVKFF